MKGFSLIEIIVVVGVISILMGTSIAGYRQFNERQKLIAAGQQMKNIIRDAQSRAYTGEINCSSCGCTPTSPGYNPSSSYLSGWRVDFGGKKVEGVCANTTPFTTKTFSSYSLSSDVTLTQPVGVPTGVLFKPFPATVTSPSTICVSSTTLSGQYYNIGIRAGGTITDSGGLVISCVSP